MPLTKASTKPWPMLKVAIPPKTLILGVGALILSWKKEVPIKWRATTYADRQTTTTRNWRALASLDFVNEDWATLKHADVQTAVSVSAKLTPAVCCSIFGLLCLPSDTDPDPEHCVFLFLDMGICCSENHGNFANISCGIIFWQFS